MSPKIESARVAIPAETEELVRLEAVKALLTATIRSLSWGEPAKLSETSRNISATVEDFFATSQQLGRLPFTAEAQQRRQRLLTELRQQIAFCRAMLRRWRRSILMRQQLLDLAMEPPFYGAPFERRRYCRE